MSETKKDAGSTSDPFEAFRGLRDAYLNALSQAMIGAVNTEGYAQTTGAMLDYYLTASAPFRDAVEKAMLQNLQQLSLPSRQEVAALAERFTNLEMRLDDLDAKVDRILIEIDQLKSSGESAKKAKRRRSAVKRQE